MKLYSFPFFSIQQRSLLTASSQNHIVSNNIVILISSKIPRHFRDTCKGNFGNQEPMTWAPVETSFRDTKHYESFPSFLHPVRKDEIAFPWTLPTQTAKNSFNFTWCHLCVQALHSHVFCCCAILRHTYHRSDKQTRLLLLSKLLRSLLQTASYLQRHNSRRNGSKARSTACNKDGGNEIFLRIRTI